MFDIINRIVGYMKGRYIVRGAWGDGGRVLVLVERLASDMKETKHPNRVEYQCGVCQGLFVSEKHYHSTGEMLTTEIGQVHFEGERLGVV